MVTSLGLGLGVGHGQCYNQGLVPCAWRGRVSQIDCRALLRKRIVCQLDPSSLHKVRLRQEFGRLWVGFDFGPGLGLGL